MSIFVSQREGGGGDIPVQFKIPGAVRLPRRSRPAANAVVGARVDLQRARAEIGVNHGRDALALLCVKVGALRVSLRRHRPVAGW